MVLLIRGKISEPMESTLFKKDRACVANVSYIDRYLKRFPVSASKLRHYSGNLVSLLCSLDATALAAGFKPEKNDRITHQPYYKQAFEDDQILRLSL
ncbi:MAG: hypothetical protein ACTXOO_05565 [Sodalis sp. (in: enterobacteria)]